MAEAAIDRSARAMQIVDRYHDQVFHGDGTIDSDALGRMIDDLKRERRASENVSRGAHDADLADWDQRISNLETVRATARKGVLITALAATGLGVAATALEAPGIVSAGGTVLPSALSRAGVALNAGLGAAEGYGDTGDVKGTVKGAVFGAAAGVVIEKGIKAAGSLLRSARESLSGAAPPVVEPPVQRSGPEFVASGEGERFAEHDGTRIHETAFPEGPPPRPQLERDKLPPDFQNPPEKIQPPVRAGETVRDRIPTAPDAAPTEPITYHDEIPGRVDALKPPERGGPSSRLQPEKYSETAFPDYDKVSPGIRTPDKTPRVYRDQPTDTFNPDNWPGDWPRNNPPIAPPIKSGEVYARPSEPPRPVTDQAPSTFNPEDLHRQPGFQDRPPGTPSHWEEGVDAALRGDFPQPGRLTERDPGYKLRGGSGSPIVEGKDGIYRSTSPPAQGTSGGGPAPLGPQPGEAASPAGSSGESSPSAPLNANQVDASTAHDVKGSQPATTAQADPQQRLQPADPSGDPAQGPTTAKPLEGTGHAGEGGWSPEALSRMQQNRFFRRTPDGRMIEITDPTAIDTPPGRRETIVVMDRNTNNIADIRFGDGIRPNEKTGLRNLIEGQSKRK
jgi:hypothetical protein